MEFKTQEIANALNHPLRFPNQIFKLDPVLSSYRNITQEFQNILMIDQPVQFG